jgi:hypothetical protein
MVSFTCSYSFECDKRDFGANQTVDQQIAVDVAAGITQYQMAFNAQLGGGSAVARACWIAARRK